MSPEHVFPDWMSRVLPRYGKGTNQRWGTRGEATVWRNDPFKDTVKCVCYPCNTTWMSHLEGRAKALLERPLTGIGTTLFAGEQLLLAQWAFKTALMIACAAEEPIRPRASYRYFYEHGKPQPETRIWIGSFVSSPPRVYQTHVGLLLGDGAKAIERPDSYLTTFAVGHVAFHVFGIETRKPRQYGFTGKLGRSLLPIWPVVPRVEWPPEFFLTMDDLDTLTDSFGPVSFTRPPL